MVETLYVPPLEATIDRDKHYVSIYKGMATTQSDVAEQVKLAYVDADNKHLKSANRYELHLSVPLPVDAFWSLTMYDAHDFYLVANPIDRFAIGDRTPGLKYDENGSLTIYMQKDSPGPDKESNWLPTPQTGSFRPIMRMYQPKEPILNGTYLLPAIKCVG